MFLLRFNATSVWRADEVKNRLGWYYKVMTDSAPARFLICGRVPVEGDLGSLPTSDLWRKHVEASNDIRGVLRVIEAGATRLADFEVPDQSFLDLKVELANRMVSECHLCEWRCGVDRWQGKKGVCKLDARSRITSYFPHFGEEAPLIGENMGGSGTIFFSGCVFHCVFCQNHDISQRPEVGQVADGPAIADIAEKLRNTGAANINFVGGDPIPNIHNILDGMNRMRVNVPMLWNSDMYMTREALQLLWDVIDIWLPDFKYGNDACARRLSRVRNYFGVVSRNHLRACEGADMIIRHLVMPNHLDCCTKPVLRFIAGNMRGVLVNVMGQYHPDYLVLSKGDRYQEIARRLTPSEIREAHAIAQELGLAYKPVS